MCSHETWANQAPEEDRFVSQLRAPLTAGENFCPRCGQENDDKRKSLRWFLRDLVENVLSWDSQLIRSLVPFLFRPGRLTREYVNGRRKQYINPIRLYLTLSVLYFFMFSLMLKERGGLSSQREHTLRHQLDNLERIQSSDPNLPDSFKLKDAEHKAEPKVGINQDGVQISFDKYDLEKITRLVIKHNLNESQLLDSLGMKDNLINRFLVHQGMRLIDATPQDILNSFVEKIPLMMFFLLPVFALLLKLFYYRYYYIEHLIFTLHIHSFLYLALSIWISIFYFKIVSGLEGETIKVMMLGLALYAYKSFRTCVPAVSPA
ncbi:MAG: DUF3667 domain-containing protein [Bacteroidia bacterium]|nr:DUF3667 domain-containing protein [Bacteroidia bacterium]